MKKLIDKDEQGNFVLIGVPWKKLAPGKIISKDAHEKLYGAIWKLKEYEDTDLDPEVCRHYKIFEDECIKNDITFNKLIELLKDGFPKAAEQEWIPASEPPKHSGKYLATVDMNGIRIVSEVGFSHGKWINRDIVAWKEKPEAYKDEETA